MLSATAVTRAVPGVKGIQNTVLLKGKPVTVGHTVDAGIITGRGIEGVRLVSKEMAIKN